MAKIYETKEDFEKDVLKDQAKDLRLQAANQSSYGLALTGLGLGIENFARNLGKTSGWLSLVTIGTSVVGLMELIRGWSTDSKAHDLELKRERLGPETIVLPPDMPLNDASEKDCGCKFKRFTKTSNPTSLTEQAVNSANDTRSKA